MSLPNSEWRRQWQCHIGLPHTFYDVKRQRHGTPLATDDVGDDQRIKHSVNDRGQTGFGIADLLLYCAVHIVKFIALK